MPRHLDLLEEPSVRILKIKIRNAIATSSEGRGVSMVHAEQGSFMAAVIQPID